MRAIGDVTLAPTLEHSKLVYRDCPWCEQEYGYGEADDGQLVVAHTLPTCVKYIALGEAVIAEGRPS